MEENATKIVSRAVLNMDFKTVVVNGKVYTIMPPTIHKIAGAGYYLSSLAKCDGLSDIMTALKDMKDAARALSFLIKGDDSLSDELAQGTLEEIAAGIKDGFEMISVQNFMTLSTLARNVGELIAKPKQ